MRTERTRIPYIDSIKGFTILLVVLGHVLRKYYTLDLYPAYTPYFKLVHDTIYAFHMPLFMLISGYLFQRSYFSSENSPRLDRLKRHWLDLAIVYTYSCLAVGIAKLIFSNDVLDPITWIDLVLIWIKPFGFLWYLHVLLVLYLINLPVCKRLGNSHSAQLIILLITAVLNIISSIINKDNAILFQICRILIYEFYFYLGVLLEKNSSKQITSSKMRFLLYVATIVLLSVKLYTGTDLVPGTGFIIAVGLSLFVSNIIKQIPDGKISQFLQFFGTICLEIYLFHQFLVTAFQKILPRIPFIGAIPSVLINFGLSILLIVAVITFLKKIRLHRFLFSPFTSFFTVSKQ